MARKHSSKSIVPILILFAAVAIWIYDTYGQEKLGSDTSKTESGSIGKYDIYHGCTLATDRGNDGDSFRVVFPDGRKEIVRLYFVDAPESAFKTYRGGENNHKRIQRQAEDLGGISPEDEVEIGKKAKTFTLDLLEKSPFTIYTEWDSPFNDRRYHGYVELSEGGKKRFLHELLVEQGLARIHTKGATMPDGTSERKQEDRLLTIEKAAKSKNAGAWEF